MTIRTPLDGTQGRRALSVTLREVSMEPAGTSFSCPAGIHARRWLSLRASRDPNRVAGVKEDFDICCRWLSSPNWWQNNDIISRSKGCLDWGRGTTKAPLPPPAFRFNGTQAQETDGQPYGSFRPPANQVC